jgi:hypothetical protein
VTGVLYAEPTARAFLDAVDALASRTWSAEAGRERAQQFDRSHFLRGLEDAIALAVAAGPTRFH